MPVDVVLIEPCFPANQREFARALHAVGARVTGIGERPREALDEGLRSWLFHYEQIPNVTNPDAVERVVKKLSGKVHFDRLEATIEAHVMAAAKVRERLGIPGNSVETTFLCRDKPAMKEVLRKAGIPCAQSIGSDDPKAIIDFAKRAGYPLIVKPRDAAGAAGTWKCDDQGQLEQALVEAHVHQGASVAVEEFIEGHEGFWDTLCVDGEVQHEFVSHYYPGVLEAMRTRWISPQFVSTNRVDSAPGYDEVKKMGRQVIKALGIQSGATHMEWFYGPKGLKFSEIGCRPPGVRAWDLYAHGNEFDIYKEWAMGVIYGKKSQYLSRKYAAGVIALRPDQDGRISHYENVDVLQHKFGEWVIDAHLPPEGTPTQPVEAGYMANAWVRMKHPDYDELRKMLDVVGQTLKVRAR